MLTYKVLNLHKIVGNYTGKFPMSNGLGALATHWAGKHLNFLFNQTDHLFLLFIIFWMRKLRLSGRGMTCLGSWYVAIVYIPVLQLPGYIHPFEA